MKTRMRHWTEIFNSGVCKENLFVHRPICKHLILGIQFLVADRNTNNAHTHAHPQRLGIKMASASEDACEEPHNQL